MGNIASTPGIVTETTIESTFSNYLRIATDGSDTYDKADIDKATTLAKTMSITLEDINSIETLPSDKAHKLRQLDRATPTLVKDLKTSIDEKYDALIKTQQEDLFRVNVELRNPQETRSLYSELAGDPVALTTIVSQLSDEEFDSLRSSPQRPVIERSTTGVYPQFV